MYCNEFSVYLVKQSAMTLPITETVKDVKQISQPWGFWYKGCRIFKHGNLFTWKGRTGSASEMMNVIDAACISISKSLNR